MVGSPSIQRLRRVPQGRRGRAGVVEALAPARLAPACAGPAPYPREPVEVTGEVTRHPDHCTGRTNLEIVADLPSQVVGAPVPGLPRKAAPPEVSAGS